METQQKFYKKILRFDEYSDLEIKELESKLFNYYNDVADYSAFNKISNNCYYNISLFCNYERLY